MNRILNPSRPARSDGMAAAFAGMALMALLSACTTAKPPVVEVAATVPPPAPAVVQTDIVLDATDQVALQAAMDRLASAPPNEAIAWSSPANGLTGAVKILRDGFDEQNRPCREFHSVITQGTLYKHSTGFLCREAQGGWSVVDIRAYPLYRLGGA